MVNKMKEEQTAFLIIGGPLDGEIHVIPSDSKRWVVPYLYRPNISNSELQEIPTKLTKEHYSKYCIFGQHQQEDIYIFVHDDLLRQPQHNYKIMIKILSHYRVIK